MSVVTNVVTQYYIEHTWINYIIQLTQCTCTYHTCRYMYYMYMYNVSKTKLQMYILCTGNQANKSSIVLSTK